MIEIEKHLFLKRWKDKQYRMLSKAYPECSKKHIMEFLDNEIKINLQNPECYIDNNYLHKKIKSTLLDIYDWIERTNPICAGHGVFFRNQHQVKSALGQMILKFLTLRKSLKARLKDFDPSSYEYATYDRKQGSEKVNANSIYGSFGAPTSFIYNPYTAPSVTATGQSLISTTCMAFENFVADNVRFNNLNECVTYIDNIINEEYPSDSILPDVELIDAEKHICGKFYRYNAKYDDALHTILSQLTQDELNRIYYKNNLFEFSHIEVIMSLIRTILYKCNSFTDPNNVPEEVSEELQLLWDYYNQYVFYNHSPVDRIQRLKNDKRKCVVTIDTDSNMLNLHPWTEFVFNDIINVDPELSTRDRDTIKFVTINIMSFVITAMMQTVLKKYCEDAHIPEDFHKYINIKNEFLFTRMILASKKKRYMSSVKLREGKIFSPEKIDIKGLDFMKSTTSTTVKNKYMQMVTKHVLHAETINPQGLLSDVSEFEKEITKSLANGEKDFLAPLSVKELEAYKDPFRGQGIRAVHAWNVLYPDMSIELPAKVDIVKVRLDEPENLSKLSVEHPDHYKVIMEKINNNPNDQIAKKGFVVLAIPKNIQSIPEWIIPYIDYDTTSFNVLKKIFPILESLGFKTLKTSKNSYFSNIVDI